MRKTEKNGIYTVYMVTQYYSKRAYLALYWCKMKWMWICEIQAKQAAVMKKNFLIDEIWKLRKRWTYAKLIAVEKYIPKYSLLVIFYQMNKIWK